MYKRGVPGVAKLRIGGAGWTIPRAVASKLPGEGSHLQRYARVLTGVEINSSFYRPHRPGTYAKWAAAAPGDVAFAVKVPKEITHERRLVGADAVIDRFLGEASALGERLGPLLVQLPPNLVLDPTVAADFFAALRRRFAGAVVCEPRHASWFGDRGELLLRSFRVARVAADPARVPAAAQPGGWPGLVYYRLHGAPTMYRSAYAADRLDALAARLRRHRRDRQVVWCIFDNTAEGAATADALGLLARLGRVR